MRFFVVNAEFVIAASAPPFPLDLYWFINQYYQKYSKTSRSLRYAGAHLFLLCLPALCHGIRDRKEIYQPLVVTFIEKNLGLC